MIPPLAALLLTIVVESVVATLLLRRGVWLESASIQLITWPVAQILVWRGANLGLVELGVAISEAFLWALIVPLPIRRAVLVSIATNAVTAGIAALLAWS